MDLKHHHAVISIRQNVVSSKKDFTPLKIGCMCIVYVHIYILYIHISIIYNKG